MNETAKNRKADRHRVDPVSARLDPELDTWFRGYCDKENVAVRQGVIAAIWTLREQIQIAGQAGHQAASDSTETAGGNP